MNTTLLLLAIAAAVATFLGGFFAVRYKDKSHLVVGFSAGAVIGVAFFDLLPESIAIGGNGITGIIAIGFLVYLGIDRLIGLHSHGHQHDGHEHHHIEKPGRGVVRAVSLCLHSLIDGVAIGVSFQASTLLGAVVAAAVLAHDFSDGINTVSAILKGGKTSLQAMKWLVLDALAPVVGIVSTMFFVLPDSLLGPLLGVFCGFFLYIGASDLIPESYHAHPTKWTTVSTFLGAGIIYVAIRLVG